MALASPQALIATAIAMSGARLRHEAGDDAEEVGRVVEALLDELLAMRQYPATVRSLYLVGIAIATGGARLLEPRGAERRPLRVHGHVDHAALLWSEV